MRIDVLNTILLIGGVQGIIFSIIILFIKKYKEKSNSFLGLLILGFALNSIQYYLVNAEIISYNILYGNLFLPFGSLNMVFFFFYVKSFLAPKWEMSDKEKWIFAPFIFFLSVSTLYKATYHFPFLFDFSDILWKYFLGFHELFSVIYSTLLLYHCYQLIRKFKRSDRYKPDLFKKHINWLQFLTLIGFIHCAFYAISAYDEVFGNEENAIYYYALWVSMSITIYILGHVGLYRFGMKKEREKIKKYYASISEEHIFKIKKHSDLIIRFENFVKTEKNFLNSQLSLQDVAHELGINKTYLSRLINAELKVNFSDYVNFLRVEEVKRYMEDPNFDHYTLLSLGLEAGFNSKSAFNASFKKFTGMSPLAFKKNQKN